MNNPMTIPVMRRMTAIDKPETTLQVRSSSFHADPSVIDI